MNTTTAPEMLNATHLVNRLEISWYSFAGYRNSGVIPRADAIQAGKELWFASRLPEIQERIAVARNKSLEARTMARRSHSNNQPSQQGVDVLAMLK